MGSKTRLSSYCTKRGDNAVNLVMSRKTNARLAHPIIFQSVKYLRYGKSQNCLRPLLE